MSEQQEHNIPDLHPVPLAGPPPSQWYYIVQMDRFGPVSLEELEQLINQGIIRKSTPVRNGQADWQRAAASKELTHISFNTDPVADPNPNPSETVVRLTADNLLAWFIVFLPVMFILSILFNKPGIDWLFVILYFGACALDTRKLKKEGFLVSEKFWWIWWFLPIPAYTWRRSMLLRQGPIYTVLSVVVIGIVLVTAVSVRDKHHSFGRGRVSIGGGPGTEAVQGKLGRIRVP